MPSTEKAFYCSGPSLIGCLLQSPDYSGPTLIGHLLQRTDYSRPSLIGCLLQHVQRTDYSSPSLIGSLLQRTHYSCPSFVERLLQRPQIIAVSTVNAFQAHYSPKDPCQISNVDRNIWQPGHPCLIQGGTLHSSKECKDHNQYFAISFQLCFSHCGITHLEVGIALSESGMSRVIKSAGL